MSGSPLPCPHCGAGVTEVRENGMMWTGVSYAPPISMSVFHWCEPKKGKVSRKVEFIGSDRLSAVSYWNTYVTRVGEGTKGIP